MKRRTFIKSIVSGISALVVGEGLVATGSAPSVCSGSTELFPTEETVDYMINSYWGGGTVARKSVAEGGLTYSSGDNSDSCWKNGAYLRTDELECLRCGYKIKLEEGYYRFGTSVKCRCGNTAYFMCFVPTGTNL